MNRTISYIKALHTPDVFFNISFLLMIPMMVLLPFTTFFMWPIGIALMLLWLCQWNWREKWENFKINDGIPYGFFLLGIFLIPILGFINSENTAIAWRSLECHLWFLFTPLIFLTTSPKTWTRRHFRLLLALFSFSVIANLAYKFGISIYKMVSTGNSKYLYGDLFCNNQHHAYVSLYANFVYLLIFKELLDHGHQFSNRKKALFYGLELFLIVGIFCAYSRAGILNFLIMHIVWCAYAIYLKPVRWKVMVGLIFLIFGIFSLLVLTAPRNRFTESYLTFNHKQDDKKQTDARLIIWQAAWDVAVENLPWGVGTGDGNQVILDKGCENGHWNKNTARAYNAHNQFLFALLTNGIIGLILVLLYFYTPLGLSIKYKDIMLLSIFLLMTLNCLVECMFDRRAGVDFFAIMIPLFIVKIHSESYNHIQE